MSPPTLSIIGGGNVGKALGRLWHAGQVFRIQNVLCRRPASASEAVRFIGAGRAAHDIGQLRPADVTMLTVPDDSIVPVCTQLAAAGLLARAGVVFHCSGALPSAAMEAALASGAAVASVHPVRSFADPEQVAQSFTQTWCGVEGDRRALDVLEPAFAKLGARLVPIDAGHKMLYHSAAVFASNYLVTLLDVALHAYGQAGIPRHVAQDMLEPLVRKTVDNVFANGPEQALSGPIARGDLATASRQYRAVRAWDKRYGSLYRQLGRATLLLAGRRRTHS